MSNVYALCCVRVCTRQPYLKKIYMACVSVSERLRCVQDWARLWETLFSRRNWGKVRSMKHQGQHSFKQQRSQLTRSFLRQHWVHALTTYSQFVVDKLQVVTGYWWVTSPSLFFFFFFWNKSQHFNMYISYHDSFLLFNDKRRVSVRHAFLKEMEALPQLVLALHIFFYVRVMYIACIYFSRSSCGNVCVTVFLTFLLVLPYLSLSLSFHLCEVTPPLTCMYICKIGHCIILCWYATLYHYV